LTTTSAPHERQRMSENIERDDSPKPDANGFTVSDVAARYRVGADKVRAWIKRGELVAINTATAMCGKPRWVITPASLAAFEKRRTNGADAKPARRRRRSAIKDYYPD
jgi:transposase